VSVEVLLDRLEDILSFTHVASESDVNNLLKEFKAYLEDPKHPPPIYREWRNETLQPKSPLYVDHLVESELHRFDLEQKRIFNRPMQFPTPLWAWVAMTWFTRYRPLCPPLFEILILCGMDREECINRADSFQILPVMCVDMKTNNYNLLSPLILNRHIRVNPELSSLDLPGCCVICRMLAQPVENNYLDSICVNLLARHNATSLSELITYHSAMNKAADSQFPQSLLLFWGFEQSQTLSFDYHFQCRLRLGTKYSISFLSSVAMFSQCHKIVWTSLQAHPEIQDLIAMEQIFNIDNNAPENTLCVVMQKNPEAVVWLIKRVDTNILNGYWYNGKTPLMTAVELRLPQVIEAIMTREWHEIDYQAKQLEVKQDDTCLPWKKYPTIEQKVSDWTHPCLTKLKSMTSYQKNYYNPNRKNVIATVMNSVGLHVSEIIALVLSASNLAIENKDIVGQKRKRKDE
jgi:hypothetical protein